MGAAWLALRVLPYPKVLRLFEPRVPAQARSRGYRTRVLRAAALIGPWMFGRKPCLPQALAARWLLGRAGYPSTLRIGVSTERERDAALAHAWLEANGRIILGYIPGWRFLPLEPLRAPQAAA